MNSPDRPDPLNEEALTAWRREFADDVHDDLVDPLCDSAPENWIEITYRASALIGNYGFDAKAVLDDGSEVAIDPGLEVLEMLGDLRPRMNMLPFGTWFTVDYTLYEDEQWDLTFDYDSDPFTPSLTPEAYAEDFDFFPRDIDFVPQWLKVHLSAARNPPDWFVQPREGSGRLPRRRLDRPTKIAPDKNLIRPSGAVTPAAVSRPSPTPTRALPEIVFLGDGFDAETTDRLIDVGRRLRDAAPTADWTRIVYSFSQVHNVISRRFQWISADGTATDYEPNKSLLSFATNEEGRAAVAAKKCPPRPLARWDEQHIFDVLTRIREGMYTAGSGTWYTATYTLDRSGTARLEFDYVGEPRFFPLLVSGIYLLDHQRFPRDAQHIPGWLDRKLAAAVDDPLSFVR